jgi:hypothetical protein
VCVCVFVCVFVCVGGWGVDVGVCAQTSKSKCV